VIGAITALIAPVADARAEWRAQGLTEAEIAANTERLVRFRLTPLVAPEAEWPPWQALPRCARCEGTGLVLAQVRDRFGSSVTQGTPCRCGKGLRYEATRATPESHTAAGKTPKTLTKFGR
jgi:hypothetical protein